MEKTIKIVTNSVPVFISVDGKEFGTEQECLNYEKALTSAPEVDALKRLLDTAQLDFYNQPLDDIWDSDDVYHYWFNLKTEQDLLDYETAFPFFKHVDVDFGVVCVRTYGWDLEDVSEYISFLNGKPDWKEIFHFSISETIDYAKWYFDELGYDVEIKPRKD